MVGQSWVSGQRLKQSLFDGLVILCTLNLRSWRKKCWKHLGLNPTPCLTRAMESSAKLFTMQMKINLCLFLGHYVKQTLLCNAADVCIVIKQRFICFSSPAINCYRCQTIMLNECAAPSLVFFFCLSCWFWKLPSYQNFTYKMPMIRNKPRAATWYDTGINKAFVDSRPI